MGQGPWDRAHGPGPMGLGLGPGGRDSGRLEMGCVCWGEGRSPPIHFWFLFLNNFVRGCMSEGRSSRGISSPGRGADQDQVFPCRVVVGSRKINNK